jgi:hypothetical protein
VRGLVDPTACAADELAAGVAEQFLQFSDTYLVCFCKSGDLLSQWRGYGTSGGYALGLNDDALAGLSKDRVMLVSVSYDEAEQKEKLAPLAFASVRGSMRASVPTDSAATGVLELESK